MEKEKDFNINENGKGNYIIKSSATFLPDKYLFERNLLDIELNDYLNFIYDSCRIIYEDLISKKEHIFLDAVGIWFKFDDGLILENSISLEILKLMDDNTDIIPIVEFVKMTLNINENS